MDVRSGGSWSFVLASGYPSYLLGTYSGRREETERLDLIRRDNNLLR